MQGGGESGAGRQREEDSGDEDWVARRHKRGFGAMPMCLNVLCLRMAHPALLLIYRGSSHQGGADGAAA